MIIERTYETVEANLLPTGNEISVKLVIYPRWVNNGDTDYFRKTIDESLSGYIYSAICEVAGKTENIEKRYEKFVSSITPVAGLYDENGYFELYDTFKVEDVKSGKAIKDVFRKQLLADHVCNLSELALIWAHSLFLLIPHLDWMDAWL